MPSSSVFKNYIEPPSSLLLATTDGRQHTIHDYLERPVTVANFQWPITSVGATTLNAMDFPDVLLSNNLYMPKLRGFTGIRADLQFRIQVNAQPFQAGRLLIVFIPYSKFLGSRNSMWSSSGLQTLAALTALPHVEIDLSQDTQANFTIPYCSPHLFYNLVTGEGFYGTLRTVVYSPLVDPTGSGSVDVNIWFNFTNINLAFPTGAPFATSSVNPVAQVGGEESSLEQTRTVSNSFTKFSEFINVLPDIPLISQIRQPVCWASDQIASVLKMFGFSKVESSNVPGWFKQGPTHFMNNYDGLNMSHNLGLESQNAVEALPYMVGNDVDEMSLSHIFQTPAFIERFNWTTSNATGTLLFSWPIHPNFMGYQDLTANTIQPSPLLYATSVCGYWRGGFDFIFKFVKTKFHSGRVRIYFQPANVNFDTSFANYNYSQVVDLRNETEIRFRVPYVATKPWLRTNTVSIATNPPSTNSPDITGTLYVEVLNELVAVSTVSATIQVLVEVCGAPDYEIAAPCQSYLQPVTVTSSSSTLRKLLRVKAQVGDEEVSREDKQGVVNYDQLGSKPELSPWVNNLATMGEKLISVRQLIKRSGLVSTITPTAATLYALNPWYFRGTYSRPSSTSPTPQNLSLLEHFAWLYAFYRGSVNYKIVPLQATQNRVEAEAIINFNSDLTPPNSNIISSFTLSSNQMTNGSKVNVITDLEGCLDLTVPFYNRFHMSVVSDLPQLPANNEQGISPDVFVALEGLPASSIKIYRSAADSFQFGYLLAPPLCEPLIVS